MKKKHLTSEVEKLKKWFKEEINRRDEIIDKLREQNALLLKNSLKQANKVQDLKESTKSNSLK